MVPLSLPQERKAESKAKGAMCKVDKCTMPTVLHGIGVSAAATLQFQILHIAFITPWHDSMHKQTL